jgi:hypothetical protein
VVGTIGHAAGHIGSILEAGTKDLATCLGIAQLFVNGGSEGSDPRQNDNSCFDIILKLFYIINMISF